MTAVCLVAEDDPAMRTWLAGTLQRAGHRPIACESARELLDTLWSAVARNEPPQFVVSDHRMRGRTGIEAFAEIRTAGCKVPLLLVTAFPDADLITQAARLHVDEVLGKPFQASELLAAIDRCLARDAVVPRQCASCGIETQALFCTDCAPTAKYMVPDLWSGSPRSI